MPTEVLQGALDDAYDASVTAANTLRAQLRLLETAKWTVNAAGQTVASVSRNNAAGGQSTSFFAPTMSGFNPVDVQIGFRYLINLHDRVLTALSLTDDTANRLAIWNEMKALLLDPPRTAELDFGNLRMVGT